MPDAQQRALHIAIIGPINLRIQDGTAISECDTVLAIASFVGSETLVAARESDKTIMETQIPVAVKKIPVRFARLYNC